MPCSDLALAISLISSFFHYPTFMPPSHIDLIAVPETVQTGILLQGQLSHIFHAA